LKIKFRESFRPFAPIVLQEHVHEYFDVPEGFQSPYMLIVAPVHPDVRCEVPPEHQDSRGIDKLKAKRSLIPAVTHVDHSARIQTVDEERNPKLHKLMSTFYAKTGCPVMINTSFNVRGEPIVCTPDDAIRCFLTTEMDVLVMGNHIVFKAQQENLATDQMREVHLSQFQLD
ncbi:MAG: hypothetical protein KDB27_30075, partial [Planctomycetales bacterium]|nr:hypothetical protein [Planctomycetales bacterium]